LLLMRYFAVLVLLLIGSAAGQSSVTLLGDFDWLKQKSWDDGAAVVSVYRGKLRWYGELRDAEVRHYIVREYMHPTELTKADRKTDASIPVLKANILISFATGTYEYRQMCSLFFDRRSGELVKAVGSSQEGCGASFQRWDRNSRELRYDTYWAGEAAGKRALEKGRQQFFPEELAILAGMLAPQELEVLPSLVSSSVRKKAVEALSLTSDKQRVRIGDREYQYDADGFLESWTQGAGEVFRRVSKKRLYYWNHTGNGDERLLK
jgi:hypothetical protein